MIPLNARTILLLMTLLTTTIAQGQNLGFYGGAGISFDRFRFDPQLTGIKGTSLRSGPLAVVGLRYHTLQNFDLTLDASIGITKIDVPVPEGVDGHLIYEQLQSLIMVGSGMNIPLEKANLMPFIQLGGGFFDFWSLTAEAKGGAMSVKNNGDLNTNRWAVVCGAGIDYQFRLFLSSGLNLRFIYTPLEVFRESAIIHTEGVNGPADVRIQGKFLQAQLTYRVNLPLAKWKEDYNQY